MHDVLAVSCVILVPNFSIDSIFLFSSDTAGIFLYGVGAHSIISDGRPSDRPTPFVVGVLIKSQSSLLYWAVMRGENTSAMNKDDAYLPQRNPTAPYFYPLWVCAYANKPIHTIVLNT